METSHLIHLDTLITFKEIPTVGWALTNIICLAMGNENESVDAQCFHQGLDHALYVHVVNYLSETLLSHLYNVGWIKMGKKAIQNDVEASIEPRDTVLYENEEAYDYSFLISYTDQFRPVCQQWHLQKLLAAANKDAIDRAEILLPNGLEYLGKLDLSDIALFYSNMLKIYAILNPIGGSLPVLNMLSFTPGFLVNVWHVLEDSIFHGDNHTSDYHMSGKSKHDASESRLKHVSKDGGYKWVSVLHKLTGKSHAASYNAERTNSHSEPSQMNVDSSDVWDIEPMRRGPQGISKDTFALLHIFCATYSHLLLVLDDIEFYEKQVICSVLWSTLTFLLCKCFDSHPNN